MLDQIVEEQDAVALLGAALADGEELGEAAPGGAVLGVGEDIGGAVGEHEAGADRELHTLLLRDRVRPNHAGDGVAVGDAKAGEPELLGALDEFLRM